MTAPEKTLVGVYCRLSREDDTQEDVSTSIIGQEKMLTDYATERGWTIFDKYIDDGYSGTNFSNRPAFTRLLKDIEKSKINCIIVRDLSRFGRNYAKAGYYLEEYFPEHHIRFIAVNDHYDTEKDDDDIVPFKNVFNEMYARDISGKTKSAKVTYAKQGKFLGSVPPYGYQRSPMDKHILIVDPDKAPIVKRMFQLYLTGISMRSIADIFNQEGILSPRAAYYESVHRENPLNEARTWNANTIRQIMNNIVYCGHMAQCKRKSLSYKSKLRLAVPEKDWIVVRNTHEPIIDEATWKKVNDINKKLESNRMRTSSSGEVSLFAGFVFCEDCGSAMSLSVYRYRCSRYVVHGNQGCTPHTINMDLLYDTVLTDIQRNAVMAAQDEQSVIEKLNKIKHNKKEEETENLRRNIRTYSGKLASTIDLARKLFEEKSCGNIPDTLFKEMMQKYNNDQLSFQNTLNSLNSTLTELEQKKENIIDWTKLIRRYSKIEKLDRQVLFELIDRIEIGDKKIIDGKAQQKVTIVYKFAGNIAA